MDCEQKKMSEKNLKKKIIAGALALISAVSLCGCSDGDWDDYEEYDSEETSYEDNSNTNTEKSDSDFTDTNISENTLQKHLQNLFRKFGVGSKWELMKKINE